MTETKENIKKRIDTNKNQHIENNEIDNFLKNSKSEELNNLGEHINNLPIYNNDELKKALNDFFRSPERNKYDQLIKNKVRNNQPLNKTELSLMYLAMISDPNKHFTQQQLKFNSNESIDQICGGTLIRFIRTKYNFPTYTGKKVEIKLPNQAQKKKNTPSVNPMDRTKEAQKIGGSINLPQNIGEIKENDAAFYCDRLITRAENNFSNEISKAKRELERKHRYKNDNEKQAYIKYDTLLIAFEKYTEIVGKKHDTIIHQSGYENKEDFENQLKLIEAFEKEMKQKYPNIDTILSKIKEYEKKMENNEKKYFNNENERKKAEQNSKKFNEYIDKKTKELDIDKTKKSLNKDPETPKEAEEYCKNLNKIFIFQEEISEKSKSYGDSITKYQKYVKGAINIQNKYNIQQYQNILDKYNQDISYWNKKINFKKYENYTSLLKNDGKLTDGLKNISTLNNLIVNSKSKSILVKEFKQIERLQQIKQEETDKFWDNIKKFNGSVYWTLTTLTGLWNGLIDATVGTFTSFMVFEAGLFHGKEDAFLIMDVKEKIDNYLKKDQSSTQKEDIYNSETKEFNFHADNTVTTVASSISQMLTLIYGGGALAKGATKAFGIGEKIAGKIGLFSSSFIMQVGGSYQEAITSGLTGGEALGYSMLSATIQSGLELLSPNEVLLGKGSGITKELIKNACRSGSKESLKMIGKTFTKNVGLEIAKENIQEALQLAAGNLINMTANGTFGSELGADRSWKNFASTAIITTLTTGITTGTSTGLQMNNLSSQDKTKLIEHIKNDKGTYIEVTEMIDKAIAGKVKIPNVEIQQLQNLKGLLSNNKITGNTNYFDGKSHKFDVTETQARGNSEMMDNLLNEIKKEGITEIEITEKLGKLRKTITEQYKQSTGEELNLTDEQLLSILDAHEQDGELGKLKLGELKVKVKILSETITDPKLRRFLLEAGFCGNQAEVVVEQELTPEQVENIKKIREELGIDIYSGDIEDIKDIKLTPEQIENIKKIRDQLGINIDSWDIENIKDIKLTSEQVENIKKIKNELGIDVYLKDINKIKDAKLTPEQVENIKKIKNELGIDVYLKDINKIKDAKLTPEQVENIKKIKDELGIDIYSWNIEDIKDIKLTPEQVENIKKIKDELGIDVDFWDIENIKDIKLTSEQVENIKKIKDELGINISSGDIDKIKDMKLTPEQVENIKKIKDELGIDIYSWNIEDIKDIKLTPEQVENIKKIRDQLGINIDSWDIENIKDIKLTSEQVENIKKIKDELGINISSGDIDKIKDMKLTPEQVENIKKIKDELGIDVGIYEIKGIINNPEILSVNSEHFYEGYNYTQDEIEAHHNYKRGRIIENIQLYIQNIISENRNVGEIEIIDTIRADLVTLPIVERIKILGGINKVVNKFNTVRKYIDFKNGPYKTPKELLCAMRGITDKNMIDKIADDITVVQHGVGIHFFVGDKTSYQIIHDISLNDSGIRSGGFNSRRSAINELEGTLSVGNSKDPGFNKHNYNYGTILHEGQHNWNTYFMPDKNNKSISRAKDEITAFLRDGRGIFKVEKWDDTIKDILTEDGGLYHYEDSEGNKLEGEKWENHKKQVRELCGYAKDLIKLTEDSKTGLTRDKVISMLSDTPADGRKDLHSHIMEAVELHKQQNPSPEQIQNLRQRFVSKIKERAENHQLIKNLADAWNYLFSKYKIDLAPSNLSNGVEFWWAGTAKKETEIEEIQKAETIEEIKHILNNPKYSHIGRGRNNRGGIEISAIIDEVVAGRVESDILPIELRSKVEGLIRK